MEQNQSQQPPVFNGQAPEPQYATYVPMMGFWESVKTCFKKCFDFKGRARRSEYWWFILFGGILAVVWTFFSVFLSVFVMIGSSDEISEMTFIVTMLSIMLIPLLVLIFPQYSAMTRRLHDTGRSGWWVVASLVVGLVYMGTYFMALLPLWDQVEEGVVDPNQFQIISNTLQTSPALGVLLCILALVSLGIAITMLVFTIQDSDRGVNKYGPSPKYP